MDNQPAFARFVWNVTPKTKILQVKSSIPAAVHYTPLESNEITQIDYIPLTCECEAVMSYHCPIDFNTKSITCCICGRMKMLPPNYAQNIRPNKLPFQLMPSSSTFEFKTPRKQRTTESRIGYLFVVDLCIVQKEMVALRGQLAQVISRLPPDCHVGLITYHKHVHAYDFSSRINTVHSINGSKDYQPFAVLSLLEVASKADINFTSNELIRKFIVPLEQYRDRIMLRVKNIKHDNHVYVNERNHCALGQALHVAVSQAEVASLRVRIVVLAGGPCTIGPGIVISPTFKSQMRSAEQLSKGENIEHFAKAKHFFDSLLKRALSRKIIVDLFAFSLNQIGFTEMSQLIINSGGFVVLHEEFSDRIFKESFQRIFPDSEQSKGKLLSHTEAIVLVYCSNEVSINGAFGQCSSLNKMKPFVSQKTIGKGKTHAWYLGAIDQRKTITILYESKEAEALRKVQSFAIQSFFMQFKTLYRNYQGEYVTRITTTLRDWGDSNEAITKHFDDEAAIVLLGRMCACKMLYQEQKNLRQWLDQCLCKWAQNYSNYIRDDEKSFSLPESMRMFPQLIYHLRRSHFVNRFGCSLDESFYFGYNINRESVPNCLAMIQPTLLRYSLDNLEPIPVQLDQEQMKDDVILLLDSYFVVIEWYGEHVQSWYDSHFHEQEEYAHIAELMDSPRSDIEFLMEGRFPVANYYKVHPYHSKERYLKSRVNPKKRGGQQHENMLTDDTDLKGFTQHLIRVVVKHS